MKYKSLILFAFLCFHTFYSFAFEKNAKIDYEIIKSIEQPFLKLIVTLIDTSEMNPTSRFPPRPSTVPAAPNIESFKALIINSLNNNPSLEIYVKRPDYINEMLNFIQSPIDKERAIEIYNQNNYEYAFRTNIKQGIVTKNGVTEKQITIEFMIPLIVSKSSQVTLNSSIIEYDGKSYKTGVLKIMIEK